VSPSARLIELARVGCHIQSSRKAGLSDDIRVPPHIAHIDAAVAALPEGEGVAVALYYLQARTRARRSLELLRAETALVRRLYGDVQDLDTPE
jgi:hypothetical protein